MSDDFYSSHPPALIADLMQFSEIGRSLMADIPEPRQARSVLQQAGCFGDAVGYIAFCLPKRYIPVWVCQCIRDQPASHEPIRMADAAAVAIAERWVRQPSEANRQAALDFATRAGFQTVGDWLAATVGWADGSLSPPHLPVVPPAVHLPALAAKAALQLLAARGADSPAARHAAYIATATRMFQG